MGAPCPPTAVVAQPMVAVAGCRRIAVAAVAIVGAATAEVEDTPPVAAGTAVAAVVDTAVVVDTEVATNPT